MTIFDVLILVVLGMCGLSVGNAIVVVFPLLKGHYIPVLTSIMTIIAFTGIFRRMIIQKPKWGLTFLFAGVEVFLIAFFVLSIKWNWREIVSFDDIVYLLICNWIQLGMVIVGALVLIRIIAGNMVKSMDKCGDE